MNIFMNVYSPVFRMDICNDGDGDDEADIIQLTDTFPVFSDGHIIGYYCIFSTMRVKQLVITNIFPDINKHEAFANPLYYINNIPEKYKYLFDKDKGGDLYEQRVL